MFEFREKVYLEFMLLVGYYSIVEKHCFSFYIISRFHLRVDYLFVHLFIYLGCIQHFTFLALSHKRKKKEENWKYTNRKCFFFPLKCDFDLLAQRKISQNLLQS